MLFYISLFGLGLILAAGWETGKWGKVLIIKLYSGLCLLSLAAAILNWISPIALRKILGWGPQLNELIGNPFPERLTSWGLLILIAVIAVVAYCWKSKKWNAIFGVLFLVAIIGGGIFLSNCVMIHFRTGRWPWENQAIDRILEAPAGFEKYQIDLPPGGWEANTQKYSEKGYLRVDVSEGEAIQMAFGRDGERRTVSPKKPFEIKNAPVGTLVYLWSNSSRKTRVIITTD